MWGPPRLSACCLARQLRRDRASTCFLLLSWRPPLPPWLSWLRSPPPSKQHVCGSRSLQRIVVSASSLWPCEGLAAARKAIGSACRCNINRAACHARLSFLLQPATYMQHRSHELQCGHERQFTSVTSVSGASLNEHLGSFCGMISASRLPGKRLFFSSRPVTVSHCMIR
jgi:hypothetical protein